MRRADVPPAPSDGAGDQPRRRIVDKDHAGGLRTPVPGDRGSAVRAGATRLEGVVSSAGRADLRAGPLPRGRQHPSGAGPADGGAVGPAGGDVAPDGPRFDRLVEPGGYAWWYVDALSDDGRTGLVVIAFIGSVFSPYYAAARRRGAADPLDHCAINVALYRPGGNRWAMTERRRSSLDRSADRLSIGPSALAWNGGELAIAVAETTMPVPRRLRGTIRVIPEAMVQRSFALDRGGRHVWQPIAPAARVEVALDHPALRWSGTGYIDSNFGSVPLERDFACWTWSRAAAAGEFTVLYDVERRDGSELSLALRFDRHGDVHPFPPPPPAALPTTPWRMARSTRSDDGAAAVARTFEDSPFYTRSAVATRLRGASVLAMHEALSLDRFSQRWVQTLLPFRMPRAWR